MYTQQDLNNIKAQEKKRWMVLGAPCLVLFIGMIVSLVFRIEWLTIITTIIMGGILIAGYELYIRPLHRYHVFLRNALHGIVRETDCYFKSISRTEEAVDGVICRTLIATDPKESGKVYERLFYFDALKEFPQMEEGQHLHVRYHDRYVVSLELI